jgi:hypothetical protein
MRWWGILACSRGREAFPSQSRRHALDSEPRSINRSGGDSATAVHAGVNYSARSVKLFEAREPTGRG